MLTSLLLTTALTLSPAHASEAWPDVSSPVGRTSDGSKDAALVIAIEDYAAAGEIPGALDNARAWMSWLDSGHGVPLVKPLFNQQAAKESMLAEVSRIASAVQPGGRLWVVYIGHGAPSESGDDGLLVGWDAIQTPQSIEDRSLARGDLLAAAENALPADAELVLVQDACFSGKTSRGDLAPGMAPLKTVSARLGPNVTVLSAARSDEYAGPLSDGTRPAFSYLVLGALRGWGDQDGDGRVSAQEAVRYANRALLQTTTGRSQTPELAGPDLTLGRSGRERAPDLTALALAAVSTPSVPSGSAGAVQVDLGGEATDFAALAAQAAAAQEAREAAERQAQAAERQAQAAEAALAKERRRRLDAAASEVKATATRDFATIASLVGSPSPETKPVLEAWLERYGSATVTIDGTTEAVSIPEVAKVQEAIGRIAAVTPGAVSPVRGKAGIEWIDLGRFSISKTEVTVGQYRQCVEAGVCKPPADKSVNRYCNWGHSGREDHPVNCVNWYQARVFAEWAGGRLPTGEEWTHAATSGGRSWDYPWGDEEATCGRAIMDDEGDGCGQDRTWPVCSKPAGNSTQGVCDLAGNVWEWTDDRAGSSRVYRGGGWGLPAPYLRASYRAAGDGPYKFDYRLGFRLVR